MIKNNIPDFKTIVRIDDNGMGGGEKPLIETHEGNDSKKMRVTDIILPMINSLTCLISGFVWQSFHCFERTLFNCTHKKYCVKLFGVENVVGR